MLRSLRSCVTRMAVPWIVKRYQELGTVKDRPRSALCGDLSSKASLTGSCMSQCLSPSVNNSFEDVHHSRNGGSFSEFWNPWAPDLHYHGYDPELDVYETLARSRDITTDYSRKVFIGGLPMGLSGEKICEFFSSFGHVTVDWPHRERSPHLPPHGYAFVVFASTDSVRLLISKCIFMQGKLCIRMFCSSTIGERDKVVQVRPWCNSDRVFYNGGFNYHNLDMRYSVFIGGVPRTTTAAELAYVLQSSIGNVAMVSIEVDYDTEYPKGAARVVFCHRESYVSAVARRHIIIHSSEQQKEVCSENTLFFTNLEQKYHLSTFSHRQQLVSWQDESYGGNGYGYSNGSGFVNRMCKKSKTLTDNYHLYSQSGSTITSRDRLTPLSSIHRSSRQYLNEVHRSTGFSYQNSGSFGAIGTGYDAFCYHCILCDSFDGYCDFDGSTCIGAQCASRSAMLQEGLIRVQKLCVSADYIVGCRPSVLWNGIEGKECVCKGQLFMLSSRINQDFT
uniref:RRM domain-containing protein n=1 Tax=Heterorhabditis bacteriophora TaxID=37862 RepID=A0A1I7XPC3_HETBA